MRGARCGLSSKHSKLREVNGVEVKLMSFDESLPSYIAFVKYCFMDKSSTQGAL